MTRVIDNRVSNRYAQYAGLYCLRVCIRKVIGEGGKIRLNWLTLKV